MSIRVQSLTKVYGAQKALDGVSFSINPGEVVGLLGPNGAGKSTLMKIITCFIPPTAGSASVYGHDILEESIEVRKRVGYLPESNPLYPDLYVREYLEFVSGIYKLRNIPQRVREIIELTGLQEEQKKKIGALSKGYRQRVGLAQAMIHNPDVLILDEPTSGLDPNQLVGIRNLIREIGREKTVMLSTHIMQEVEAICGRAIIINKGRIVADDFTQNLLAQGGQNRIRVEFNKPVNHQKLSAIPGVKRVREIDKNTFEIHSGQEDIREQVFQFAVKNELAVLSMQHSGQGIESVFHQLTQEAG